MVAYSFQRRFEAPIVADVKLHTIRAPRKRHARFGDELQLYVGMRTKQCRLIARRRALSAHNIVIDVKAETILVGETYPACRIGPSFGYEWEGQKVRLAEVLDRDAFAIRDGFEDWRDMRSFWLEQHAALTGEPTHTAFHGVIIRWAPGDLKQALSSDRPVQQTMPAGLNLEEMGVL